eukprot:CAMPEP_0117459988 /NCGR_PEP_ID=MMETSP0784-20121206/1766_1 /TAXON_ID=39447 /ORGANISM="" /LENGTH=1399 /DNA_ID=CAMNT_0005253627 /DNA_START=19 /DNA_END=4218 /DNA_ORIENTATION=-
MASGAHADDEMVQRQEQADFDAAVAASMSLARDSQSAGTGGDAALQPEPPRVAPMRKADSERGARGVLSSLRALGPSLVRWSSGSALSNGSDSARGPRSARSASGAQSSDQLPSVPVSAPAPRSGSGRRPNGRRAPTPRDQAPGMEVANSTGTSIKAAPVGVAAAGTAPGADSPRLPAVPSPVPPPRSSSSSARVGRSSDASESSARRPQSDSPAPRRPAAAGVSGSAASRSAPVAPGGMPTPTTASVVSGKCREMLEVQTHAQQLLGHIYDHPVTEEAAVSILDEYPELAWLANCMRRCPLPPGWTSMEGDIGQMQYINTESGDTTSTPPLLQQFAELAGLMLQWRQDPSSIGHVVAILATKHETSLDNSRRARKVWNGPHSDPATGVEFWHCEATGRSSWGDPGMASEFIARIADRLRQALPTDGSAPNMSAASFEQHEHSKHFEKSSEPQAEPRPPSQPRPQQQDPNGLRQSRGKSDFAAAADIALDTTSNVVGIGGATANAIDGDDSVNLTKSMSVSAPRSGRISAGKPTPTLSLADATAAGEDELTDALASSSSDRGFSSRKDDNAAISSSNSGSAGSGDTAAVSRAQAAALVGTRIPSTPRSTALEVRQMMATIASNLRPEPRGPTPPPAPRGSRPGRPTLTGRNGILRTEDATPRGPSPSTAELAAQTAAALHNACGAGGALTEGGSSRHQDLAERGRRLDRVLRETSRGGSYGPSNNFKDDEDDGMGSGNRVFQEASAELRAASRPHLQITGRRRPSSTEPLESLAAAAAKLAGIEYTPGKQVRFAERPDIIARPLNTSYPAGVASNSDLLTKPVAEPSSPDVSEAATPDSKLRPSSRRGTLEPMALAQTGPSPPRPCTPGARPGGVLRPPSSGAEPAVEEIDRLGTAQGMAQLNGTAQFCGTVNLGDTLSGTAQLTNIAEILTMEAMNAAAAAVVDAADGPSQQQALRPVTPRRVRPGCQFRDSFSSNLGATGASVAPTDYSVLGNTMGSQFGASIAGGFCESVVGALIGDALGALAVEPDKVEALEPLGAAATQADVDIAEQMVANAVAGARVSVSALEPLEVALAEEERSVAEAASAEVHTPKSLGGAAAEKEDAAHGTPSKFAEGDSAVGTAVGTSLDLAGNQAAPQSAPASIASAHDLSPSASVTPDANPDTDALVFAPTSGSHEAVVMPQLNSMPDPQDTLADVASSMRIEAGCNQVESVGHHFQPESDLVPPAPTTVPNVSLILESDDNVGSTSPSAAAQPTSPSLMSICRSPAGLRCTSPGSPVSPSILILDDPEPERRWASCKPLPPQREDAMASPPRRRLTPVEERPVRLLAPEPLSARGRERCKAMADFIDVRGSLSARGPRKAAADLALPEQPHTARGPAEVPGSRPGTRKRWGAAGGA